MQCWGDNSSGQVGDGRMAQRTLPGDVEGVTGARALTVGGVQSCIMTAGGVKCWGGNDTGELGDGEVCGISACSSPVDVLGLTSNVAAVSAGFNHTCALTTAGGVKCWGAGPLGNGTEMSSTTSVDVSGPHERRDRRVRWLRGHLRAHNGGRGQMLGRQPLRPAGRRDEHRPAVLRRVCCAMQPTAGGGERLDHWRRRHRGWRRSFMRTHDGRRSQSAGDVTIVARWEMERRPTARFRADVVGLASGVAAISTQNAIAFQTCAIMATGGLKCWGSNGLGEVGNGQSCFPICPTPLDVPGLTSGVARASAGGGHTAPSRPEVL